jgi:hypothetical protein
MLFDVVITVDTYISFSSSRWRLSQQRMYLLLVPHGSYYPEDAIFVEGDS